MSKETSNHDAFDGAPAEGGPRSDGTEAGLRLDAGARHKPRWRSIEQYWEDRRLREHLKDYLADEE